MYQNLTPTEEALVGSIKTLLEVLVASKAISYKQLAAMFAAQSSGCIGNGRVNAVVFDDLMNFSLDRENTHALVKAEPHGNA